MTSQNHFYIDIHVLQTVPPSCVNRDDTGSPKTAIYGGVPRARVSSQSWKHEIRMMFKQMFADDQLGFRTKHIVGIVADEIKKLAPELDAEKKASEALTNAGLKIKSAEKGTDALFFMSRAQAFALAKLTADGETDKQKYKEALKNNPSIDMALFGRMVADDQSLNYDAAAQVAHAISTHGVRTEYDFFSAVDDCKPEDNAGAGHLGTVEFNSSTMYRYATVNAAELVKSISVEDLSHAVRCFAEAFICSMPTGKQNTFANRTMPDLVYIAVRNDQPVNLVGAFEKPVSSHGGYVEASENAFVNYAKDTYRLFASEPVLSLGVSRNGSLGEIAELMPLQKLLDKLETYVSECIGG